MVELRLLVGDLPVYLGEFLVFPVLLGITLDEVSLYALPLSRQVVNHCLQALHLLHGVGKLHGGALALHDHLVGVGIEVLPIRGRSALHAECLGQLVLHLPHYLAVEVDTACLVMVEPVEQHMCMVVGLPVFIVPSCVHTLPLLAVMALVHLLTLSLLFVKFSPVSLVEMEVDAHGMDAIALVAPVRPRLHLIEGGVLLDDHHSLLHGNGAPGHPLVCHIFTVLALDGDLLGCVLMLRLLLHLVDRFFVLHLPDPLGLVLRLEFRPGVVQVLLPAVVPIGIHGCRPDVL